MVTGFFPESGQKRKLQPDFEPDSADNWLDGPLPACI